MTYDVLSVVQMVQQDIASKLNAHLSDKGLKEVAFFQDPPRIESDTYAMGIYLASPNGEVYSQNENNATLTIVLDCLLDDVSDNSHLPQEYLSTVIQYLNKKTYGFASSIQTASLNRVDNGDVVNWFGIAIDIVCGVFTDYDL